MELAYQGELAYKGSVHGASQASERYTKPEQKAMTLLFRCYALEWSWYPCIRNKLTTGGSGHKSKYNNGPCGITAIADIEVLRHGALIYEPCA